MPVTAPPIDPAEQFLGAKSQPGEFVRTLGRCVAADPVTVDDIDLAAVEPCGRFSTHLPMREADSAEDVAGKVCIARAGVDHNDFGKPGFEINGQIPRVGVEAQFVFHHRHGFTWLRRAVFKNCGSLIRHDWLRFRGTIRSSIIRDSDSTVSPDDDAYAPRADTAGP